MRVALGDPDQLASPLFESAARVRDDGIARFNRLCFKLNFTYPFRHTRSEARTIWYPFNSNQNPQWMGVALGDPDQLASPLFESAARVRDDGIARFNRLCFKLNFTYPSRHTRSEARTIWYPFNGNQNPQWMGVAFGDPDQLASPLFESAARVRDDGIARFNRLCFKLNFTYPPRHTRSEV